MPPKKKVTPLSGLFAGVKKKIKKLSSAKEAKPAKKITKPKHAANVPDEVLVTFSLANVAKVVVVTMLLVLLGAFLYRIQEILLIIFVAFLLASALIPAVDYLKSKKIPAALSVIVIYLVAISLLVLFMSNLVPILGTEILGLGRNLRDLIVDIGNGDVTYKWLDFVLVPLNDYLANVNLDVIFDDLEGALVSVGRQLTSIADNAVGVLVSFSNGLLNMLLVLVLSFFFIVERNAVYKFMVRLFPKAYEDYILQKNKAIQKKIGYWLQGQLILMIVVGVITYVGLLILGVDYALTLAVLAGLAELLPVIGPIVAFLVAVPIVANQALWLILGVGILFFIIQQLENNVLVPMIMKKAVGISPIVVIVSMWIGGTFLGILGLILSVPVATTVGIFVADYLDRD